MKYPNIPFRIGMEYENWEFDLEILPDRLEGYDSYRYIGNELNNFLNYPIEETELIFSFEILVAIIIKFKSDLQLDVLEQFNSARIISSIIKDKPQNCSLVIIANRKVSSRVLDTI